MPEAEGKLVRDYTTLYNYIDIFIEGSLEAKLPTIWTNGKASQPRRRSEMEKVRREKMQVREKVGKSQNTLFSNVLWLRRVKK